MSLQWEGKYKFEAGDIVEVIGENHPLVGQRGIVYCVMGSSQFGVMFQQDSISLWADNLKLIETHRPVDIPKEFKEAFNE